MFQCVWEKPLDLHSMLIEFCTALNGLSVYLLPIRTQNYSQWMLFTQKNDHLREAERYSSNGKRLILQSQSAVTRNSGSVRHEKGFSALGHRKESKSRYYTKIRSDTFNHAESQSLLVQPSRSVLWMDRKSDEFEFWRKAVFNSIVLNRKEFVKTYDSIPFELFMVLKEVLSVLLVQVMEADECNMNIVSNRLLNRNRYPQKLVSQKRVIQHSKNDANEL